MIDSGRAKHVRHLGPTLRLLAGSGAVCLTLASCAGRVPSPTRVPLAPSATFTVSPEPSATASPAPSLPSTAQPPTPTPQATPIAPLLPGQAVSLDHIWMIDVDHGWGIGGATPESADHILRTGDGGQTWQDVTPPEPQPEDGQEKTAIGAFLDSDTGWVIYAYRQFHIIPQANVWSTQDGGATWTPSAPLAIGALFEFFSPSNLTFIDPQHGWVMVHAGAGMMHDYMSLYRTVDGGRTWDEVVEAGGDQIQVCPKTGMAFADADHGWITRDCGGVMDGAFVDVTFDGGSQWSSVQLPVPSTEPHLFNSGAAACAVSSPWLFSPEQGALAVRCVTGPSATDVHPFLYTTSNSGSTWQATRYPGGDLRFFDQQTALGLSRTIALTRDGGRTWKRLKTVNWDGQFSFVDVQTGWAVARDQGQVALVKTVDGGRTWQEINPAIVP